MFLSSTQKTILKNIAPFLLIFLIYLPALFIFYKYSERNPSGYSFPVLLGDSTEYVTLAKNMIDHRVFSLDTTPPFYPNNFRTPGYPLFLAIIFLFSKNLYLVSFMQIILAGITAFLIFKIGRQLAGATLGAMAMIFFILNASTLYYTLAVMSDILFVFLIILSIYIMFFWNSNKEYLRISLAGFLIGYAILTRPIAVLLPVLFVIYYFFLNKNLLNLKKTALLILIFIASLGIVVTPWVIRNKIQNGNFTLSSTGGNAFFYFNIPSYLTFKYGFNIRETTSQMYMEAGGLSEEEARELKNSKKLKGIVWKYISRDPIGYAEFHLSRLPQFLGGSNLKNFYADALLILQNKPNPFADKTLLIDDILKKKDIGLIWARIKSQSFFPLEYVFWFVILFFSLFSVITKKHRYLAMFFMSIILYFAVLTGPSVHVRYRLPAEPFLFLLAVIGLNNLKELFKKKTDGQSQNTSNPPASFLPPVL